LIGVTKPTFYRIVKNCSTIPSAVSERHKLTGKTAEESNRMDVRKTEIMISAIHEVLNEYTVDVPWFKSYNADEVPIKMLPPYFSKEKLYD